MANKLPKNNYTDKSSSSDREEKAQKKAGWRIFFLIILVYSLFSFLPSVGRLIYGTIYHLPGILQESGTGEEQEQVNNPPFSQLVLLSAEVTDLTDTKEWQDGTLKANIPELEKTVIEDGNRLYRFDVTVYNKGTKASDCEREIFVDSHQGMVSQQNKEWNKEDKTKDTRIIPPKRQGIIAVYAIVSNGTSEVYLRTYNTNTAPDSKLIVTMPNINQ